MRFLWAFRCNPIAQRLLRNRPRHCREAISGAQNCLRQFCTDNQAEAICGANCP
ncbi:MAG: hypothetical protein LBK44_05335 [Spirochaetales bacterium]|nr:hypothetical protein [Spirochaetales bacterium]